MEGTTAEGTTVEGTTVEGTTAEGTTAEGTTVEGTTVKGTTVEDQVESAEEVAKRDKVEEEEEEERVISYDYEEMKSKAEVVSVTAGNMLELQYPICVTVLISTLSSFFSLLSLPSISVAILDLYQLLIWL